MFNYGIANQCQQFANKQKAGQILIKTAEALTKSLLVGWRSHLPKELVLGTNVHPRNNNV